MDSLSAAASTSLKNGSNTEPSGGQVAGKDWRVRKEASDDLNAAFESRCAIKGGDVTELFGKLVDDSNAAAMECGLPAVLTVVDKGFSGRPGAVNLAEEVVLEFVHLCSTEDTIAVLLEGSRNKRPKVLPLCVSSIFACFKAFGPRTVPMAAVKKEFKALCESTVNNVRPNAVKLMGESPTNQWLLVDRYCPRPAKEAQEGVRPGEFADTINLLDRLPKTEFKAKMALSKWSEKVDALKIILDIVGSVPKLETGDYNDLVQTLKT
ncbi:hypothetical protein DYB36_005777 [Aphanomyces astaci]|uniref:XMAP215/Dis1/CLASP TOG domain-containing protein n=1 Tax=Aphanomyces astaci TaxID=112090 RepID=A0A397ANM1_APHAT|nr:hypothetical protein DYB36_005777 [Aphanomyces astaci]